jgi:hypothetical protein
MRFAETCGSDANELCIVLELIDVTARQNTYSHDWVPTGNWRGLQAAAEGPFITTQEDAAQRTALDFCVVAENVSLPKYPA